MICFIGICATCNKRIDCKQTIYSFSTALKAYPDSDSINIGDTLWIEFYQPVVLTDVISGSSVNYSEAVNLGTVLSFVEFEKSQERGAVADFKLQLYEGKISPTIKDSDINQEYLFVEESAYYKFKLAIIPKKRGNYVVTISNANNVYRKSDKCTKASFELKYGNTNQHFYLLKQWQPDIDLQEPGKSRVYYFKVK